MVADKNKVIVVNERDEWLGTMDKLEAHRDGILHRAFSVFVLNDKNELLIQQRADDKYHTGGLWSNTCCSHPVPHESTLAAAHRRLQEELGFDCELEVAFTMYYKAPVGNGLTEHEYDHIYTGIYDGPVTPSADEVQDYKFIGLPELEQWMTAEPEMFTPWLHLAYPKFLHAIEQKHQPA